MKTFSGRPASQRADEIEALIARLKARNVRSYLEIGARDGDTFHHVMKTMPAGSFGVAVDLPGGAWGRRDTAKNLKAVISDLRDCGYDAHAVFGSSRDAVVVEQVRRMLASSGGGRFDACLIDGDHRYAAVKGDFFTWGNSADLVAFHDIDGDGLESKAGDVVEVPRFWAELKTSLPADVVCDIIGTERGMGIGVVDMAALRKGKS